MNSNERASLKRTYSVELVNDVVTRKHGKFIIQYNCFHGETRKENVEIITSMSK